MSAHSRGGVAHRGAELNSQTLDGVGVVARPDLLRICEHRGVKASAAARAVFKEHIRERVAYPAHELVCAQDKAVEELALPVCGEQSGARVGDVAVKVPFDIVYFIFREHGVHLVENVVAHIFSGHIENILMPAYAGLAVRNMDAPVGVGAEEVGVGGDHLRLVPNAELKTEVVYSAYKLAESAFELALVYEPVAQRVLVVVALAEPAVVHDEHIHAEFLCALRERDKLVRIKIEERRLPAVYQQGTLLCPVFSGDEIEVIELVVYPAHLADALARVNHDRLWSLKALARLKMPGEICRIYAHEYARSARIVALGAELKVAAVNEIEAVCLAAVLVGVFRDESRKWVLAVARNSALARDALKSVGERAALLGALFAVPAVEGYEIVVHARQVDAYAHRAVNVRGSL